MYGGQLIKEKGNDEIFMPLSHGQCDVHGDAGLRHNGLPLVHVRPEDERDESHGGHHPHHGD